MVTVNCARIIHGNQVATNGVVHVIDRVISAVGTTMKDVIQVDDDLDTLNVSLEYLYVVTSCLLLIFPPDFHGRHFRI